MKVRVLARVVLIGIVTAWTTTDVKAGWTYWAAEDGGNDHWYDVILVENGGEGINWEEAKLAAEAKGGHLATITSPAENAFVFQLVDNPIFWFSWQGGRSVGPWLGGFQRRGSSNAWRWVTGEPWGYTNWASGEPNSHEQNNYLNFYGVTPFQTSSRWNDASTHPPDPPKLAYVVESNGSSRNACDFDFDGDCDTEDLDTLTAVGDLGVGLPHPPVNSKFDLTGDDLVNIDDLSQWLSDAATTNGHGSAFRSGDTDLNRKVDITDFNTLITYFDPGGVNPFAHLWTRGDFDGDEDVDITDFNSLAANFSPGGYDDNAAVAAAADLGEVDLIVDLATGEVVLDGNTAAISGLQVFSAGNSLLPTDFSAEVLQFVISTNISTYAEGAFIDTAVNGEVSLGILYDLLVDAQDVTFEYTMIGQPTVQGRVIYIPEPASLLVVGMSGLVLLRRRFGC